MNALVFHLHSLVLDFLRTQGAVTHFQVARHFGLAPHTASSVLSNLFLDDQVDMHVPRDDFAPNFFTLR